MKAKLQKKEFDLPEGYKVKDNCEYSKELQRYFWHPKAGDLFFIPTENKICEYLQWSDKPGKSKGYFVSLDGFGKIRELGKKRSNWVYNLGVRKYGIPIQLIKDGVK